MNHRLWYVLQVVSLGMLAWLGFKLLGRVHSILPVAVVLISGSNCLAAWALRYERPIVGRISSKPLARQYLNWVCRCTGDQQPAGPAAKVSKDELLLHSARDFEIAAQRAKQVVRGHDQVIDRLLARVHEAVTLRSRRRDDGGQPPLAAFLLVGGDGVGKRYLARVLAKLLFRGGGTSVFQCDGLTPETLVGSGGAPGQLLNSVRRQAYQVIVFDRIDAASTDVIGILSRILAEGEYRSSNSDRSISFASTMLVMTTTKAAGALGALMEKTLAEGAWQKQAVEVVASETLMDHSFLNAVSDVLLCHPPDDLAKSEVIAMLMQRESSAHGVALSRVDPEIITAQVMQIDDAMGFTLAPDRVKKLLRRPLVAAAQHDHKLLSLRVRH